MVLVNGIDLNDGNMDMGKMKSVLDADVENIRNAKATVEKMIEEKMLGTEADGTIGVRLADGQINYHDKKGQEYIARNTALEFLKETEQVFLFSIVKMESSCRVEIIQITDTMRQENLKTSYIKEQILQSAVTIPMMSWEIRSWQKRKDRDCRRTVEVFLIVMMH